MAAFSNLDKGNVLFTDDKGVVHAFPSWLNVLSSSDPDFIVLSSTPVPTPSEEGYKITWQSITLPVAATRAEMVRKLSNEYFSESKDSAPSTPVKIESDRLYFGDDVVSTNRKTTLAEKWSQGLPAGGFTLTDTTRTILMVL
jgi:hypothetical protein